MDGTERIWLIEPPDRIPRGEEGQQLRRTDAMTVSAAVRGRNRAFWTKWTAYAERRDGRGREGLVDGQLAGQWDTAFRVTESAAMRRLSESWELVDGFDRRYDVIDVFKVPHRRTIEIRANRRRAQGRT